MNDGYLWIFFGFLLASYGFYRLTKGKDVDKNPPSLSQLVNEICQEQLVIDDHPLKGSDLTGWFKKNNPNGTKKNVLIHLNKLNMKNKQFEILKTLKTGNDNIIVQALIDDFNDKIVLCRSIQFEELDRNLEKLLNEKNGILIVEY